MKRLSDQTLYEIIEVPVDARPEEIERACDRAASTYGPGSLVTYTLASPEESSLLSSRIEEARSVLLDPGARARYDARLGVRSASPAAERAPGSQASPAPAAPWPPPEAELPAASPRHVSPGLPAGPTGPAPAAGPGGGPAEPASAPGGEAMLPPGLPGQPATSGRPGPGPSAAPAPAVRPIPLTVRVDAGPGAPAGAPPILLDKEVPAPLPPEVAEGSAWSGEMLRRARESRGVTLQQLAERTRITRHHLENIEQDRFKALPAPVYLRGIIMSLARELRLDGQKVARSYLDRMGAGSDGAP